MSKSFLNTKRRWFNSHPRCSAVSSIDILTTFGSTTSVCDFNEVGQFLAIFTEDAWRSAGLKGRILDPRIMLDTSVPCQIFVFKRKETPWPDLGHDLTDSQTLDVLNTFGIWKKLCQIHLRSIGPNHRQNRCLQCFETRITPPRRPPPEQEKRWTKLNGKRSNGQKMRCFSATLFLENMMDVFTI